MSGLAASTGEGAYVQMGPSIGLDQQQIRILAEEGRARIEAENAAKEAKRKEKQEERMRHKGWKGKIRQGLERIKGTSKNNTSEAGAGNGAG
ncbi:hypothetical protein MMC22_009770 [Lobaria immixta]|nr:hypothetical protein [Lobaria immixta]